MIFIVTDTAKPCHANICLQMLKDFEAKQNIQPEEEQKKREINFFCFSNSL